MAKKKKGLGDYVEMIAKPIAKAIDAVAGTDLENCEGCKNRKEALNKLTKKKEEEKELDSPLSEANTELLRQYIRKEWKGYPDLSGAQQKALYGVIEEGLGIRHLQTTSCGPCWRSNGDKDLRKLAKLYNIK